MCGHYMIMHNQSIQELRSCMKRQGFGLMVSKYMLRMFGLLSLLRSKVTIWFQNSDSTRFHSISSLSMLSFVLITDLWMYFLMFPPYVSLFSFLGFQYVSQKSSPLTNLMASLRSWPQHKTSEGHRLQVACVVLRIYGLTSLLAGSSRRGWFKSVKEIQGTLLDPIGKIWPHIFHHTSTFVSRIFATSPMVIGTLYPKKMTCCSRILETLEKQSEYSVSSALEDMTTAAQALTMTESHQVLQGWTLIPLTLGIYLFST